MIVMFNFDSSNQYAGFFDIAQNDKKDDSRKLNKSQRARFGLLGLK